ncbi:hypothetical protein EZV62_006117 [Acer yangbiense]|uniref:Uncharacterized protein n=1 Tax=Acer yangbiense TaxID=1000413 RepID=A0A5C7IS62_9ROSI|nr:hypothetical protein EZV62_006117 [Acer yangbiense]
MSLRGNLTLSGIDTESNIPLFHQCRILRGTSFWAMPSRSSWLLVTPVTRGGAFPLGFGSRNCVVYCGLLIRSLGGSGSAQEFTSSESPCWPLITVAFVATHTSTKDNVVVEALVHSTAEEVSEGSTIGILGNRGGMLEVCTAFGMGNTRSFVAIVFGLLWGEVDSAVWLLFQVLTSMAGAAATAPSHDLLADAVRDLQWGMDSFFPRRCWFLSLLLAPMLEVPCYYSGEEDGLDMRKALSRYVEKKSIMPLKQPVTPDELEYNYLHLPCVLLTEHNRVRDYKYLRLRLIENPFLKGDQLFATY